MSEEHKDYRPRSPDLSAFAPPPALNRLPSYHPPDSSFPPGYSFSPRGSYDASPYFSPQTPHGGSSYFGSHFHQPTPTETYSPQSLRTPSAPVGGRLSQPFPPSNVPKLETPQNRYQPPQPPTFTNPVYHPNQAQQFPLTHPTTPSQIQHYSSMGRPRQKPSTGDFDGDYDPSNRVAPRPTGMMPGMQHAPPAAMTADAFDPSHGIDVKTKFPVARIKRIMQADEDVGKVAQATPTAVAKALELFMITLVAKGANEARQQNSKRVTAQHLKAALMKDGQFDFLADTCADVPDEGAKKGRARSEAKSEDTDDDMDGKRRKSKPKKRKTDTDDESD